MKQGKASPDGMAGAKREPRSNAMSVGAVARIGGHYIETKPQPMHKSRGFMAPAIGSESHPKGSQGRH